MLSTFRHIQKGLLLAVTAIIVVSFAFFDFGGPDTPFSKDCVVKVYDRCYRQKEAQKLATHFDVALELGMYDFAMVLFGERRMDRDPTDFIMSLIILRTEAEKMGIEPSQDEIKAAIPTLPIFQQPWVSAAYVENNILGPNGFTQSDLANLVKDYLSFQRLRDLVGAGLESIPSETEKRYVKANQRYTASVVRFDRNEHLAAAEPTEEEIAKYFEENQETLLSEAKRGYDYVKFTPKTVAEDATNEDKAKANLAFANAVNRAYSDLAEEGADFDAVAKQYVGERADFTLEMGKLEPFSPADAPELLKGNESALEGLFSGAHQIGEVTVPFQQGEGGGYLVFRFSEEVAPVPLTLEEAAPAIKEALVATKSDRAVNDAASAALAKLSEAVKSGTAFADAAKELGLSAETLPNFSESEPPADVADASVIVQAIDGLAANEVSSVTARPGGEGYLIAHIEKIEIYKDEDASTRKEALAASTKARLERTLFTAWFNQRRAESGAARPDALAAVQ